MIPLLFDSSRKVCFQLLRESTTASVFVRLAESVHLKIPDSKLGLQCYYSSLVASSFQERTAADSRKCLLYFECFDNGDCLVALFLIMSSALCYLARAERVGTRFLSQEFKKALVSCWQRQSSSHWIDFDN